MVESTIAEGVLQVAASDARWLSTGWDGGYRLADAAYNVSVPADWEREPLDVYVGERRACAGFERRGPTLLTSVDVAHARVARLDPVAVYATAGLSNPAALPMEPTDEAARPAAAFGSDAPTEVGTVNLVVHASRPLTDGALATLVATAVEAKTATLLSLTGFTGTTTDAVIVGGPATAQRVMDRPATDECERWAGSGTTVGNATRVCVRDAIRASLAARYDGREIPGDVADADHGVVTDGTAEVSEP